MNRYIINIFVFILFYSSCSLKKNILTKVNEIIPLSSLELVTKVNSLNISPNWISLNAKVDISNVTDNTKFKFSTNIRIRKDSAIWISIKAPLGIEVFRTLITPDTISFMNRLDKSYYIEPISNIRKLVKSDISFDQIQSILFASPNIDFNKIKFFNALLFSIRSSNINYSINSSNFRVDKMKIIESESRSLEINFYNYIYNSTIDNFFPNNLLVNINSDQNISAEINFTKIDFNNKSNISFNIPKSYDQKN